MTARTWFADHAWLPGGFASDVRIETNAGQHQSGTLLGVRPGIVRGDAEHLGRYVLPGMPNLHSHAFQRAMAGLAERRGKVLSEECGQGWPLLDSRDQGRSHEIEQCGQGRPLLDPRDQGRSHEIEQCGQGRSPEYDTFWTWREVMYAFAGRIGPDELRAIAAQLYVEMLKAGYTQVCEFHYLHHQPDGRHYADPAAMSLALVEAAREAGIGLTLLPVLYMTGGFDGRALGERQRRFGHDVEGYLRLLERLCVLESPMLRVGIALHSLRAVPEEAMRATLESSQARDRVIHIHIAEQIGEVQDCLALRHARPVEWLLDHAPVDHRWCLVHATHMSEDETRRLAATGAVAGLCPTTEANLGDGLFPMKPYFDAGGVIGIGSDSHISVSPVEELRWLEYGQRLALRQRNVATTAASPSTGETLFAHALVGGARAAGLALGGLSGGGRSLPSASARADLLVLDDSAPLLAGRDAAHLIDTWIFAGNSNLIRHVMVNGEWVVRDFRHRDEERIAARYRETVERLAE